MRVLVTGGAGYVGSVSVEAVLEAGHSVVVLDNLSTGHRQAVVDGARFEAASYGDAPTIARLLDREAIDAVLHCGAKSLVAESVADPALYYRENVAGGLVLLEAMRLAGTPGIVFSSTAAVYGAPERVPIEETDPIVPITPYGETKRTVEGAIGWYARVYGLRGVVLRYFNVAGATRRNGEAHDPETHLIPCVLEAAEGRRELTIFGDDYPTRDGTCVRDYVHVADLAQAHLAALERVTQADRSAASASLVCNLGSSSGFSNLEVVETAERVTGRRIPHRIGPRRDGDPPALVATSARARDVLGWRPAHDTLEEMIGSAWEWRRSHPSGYAPDHTAGGESVPRAR